MTDAPRILAAMLLAASVTGCGDRVVGPAHADEPEAPEVLSRELLFGNPDRAAVRVSPDGRHLSWIAPRDGVQNVWVAPIDDLEGAQPITDDTDRGIRSYFWAYNSRDVLYLQDEGGDENWRVYRVDIENGDEVDLTPLDGIAARIEGVSHNHPHAVLVGINDRNPALHDIYRIDLRTGERTLVLENPGFASIVTDDDFRVRFGVQMQPDGGMHILRHRDGAFEPFQEVPHQDTLTTQIIGFDESNERLLMIDSRNRNTSGLVLHGIDSDEREMIFNNERADVSSVMRHPVTRALEAAAFNFDRQRWRALDDRIARDLEFLREVDDGELIVTGRTLDDRLWIVAYVASDAPVQYYRYDRDAERADYLFSNRADLDDKPLTPMHPVVIESRDGLEMMSYLSLPLEADPDAQGRPRGPVPMVLLVHGGPWARDTYGFHPYHQWLANRGYAVLSVNFRGSTGFGKAFVNAGDREWGAAMHDDLIDAVEWAIDEGITQRDTVAIMGGSYGGYAALAGLTFTPETFACAVSIVGPSNLVTLLESVPPYWGPMIELFTQRVGDHRTEDGREFLLSRSPLSYVDRIRRPLLIGQGANDPRVTQRESVGALIRTSTSPDCNATRTGIPASRAASTRARPA
jgi:dipeptidyl aminopeptidase/acylaminoacyl peptidase